MSDQGKCTGMKSDLLNNLYGILMMVGPIFTFAVGCEIIFTAMCHFDSFMYVLGLQVLPSREVIAELFASLLIEIIIGIVLMLHPIFVFLMSGGDDQ